MRKKNKTMKKQPFIIIVDDDESVRRSLCRLLRSLNFEADAYSNANEFLEILPDVMPDCLILDVRMPKVNGLNLQKEL
ncbi:MAG: response regulator, partial [Candidatus Aminicenantes bacterium]|nr:response regulator [Candidatus Aminicenantes bacterium]